MNKPVLKHFGKVSEGKLLLYDMDRYNNDLTRYNGKEIQITVEYKYNDVTASQFGYYYGAILPTALENEAFGGWEIDELDYELKKRFLSDKAIKKIGGEEIETEIVPSKSRIGKERMKGFIEKVLNFLAEYGVEVQPPEYYKYKPYHRKKK